jgi:hypothetical protein
MATGGRGKATAACGLDGEPEVGGQLTADGGPRARWRGGSGAAAARDLDGAP